MYFYNQYIAIGKTDLFYNSMGLCGNFTRLLLVNNMVKRRFQVRIILLLLSY